MTMLHMLNCAALAFGPFAIVYYRIIMPEGLLGIAIKSGVLYAFTQMFTMLALASFVPLEVEGQRFILSHEAARTAIRALDLVGLVFAARWVRGFSRHLRIVGIAFGWAVMDAVLATGVPMIYSAASTEFDIGNTYAAVSCSLRLLKTLAMVGLLESARSKRGIGIFAIMLLFLLEAEQSLCVFLSSEMDVAMPVVLFLKFIIGIIAYSSSGVTLSGRD